MPFKVGDEVIVHKPIDHDEYPCWVDEMDEYDGTAVKIRSICGDTVLFYGTSFSFSINWIDYQASEELDDIELNMSELM